MKSRLSVGHVPGLFMMSHIHSFLCLQKLAITACIPFKDQESVLPSLIREPNAQCLHSTKSKSAFLSFSCSASLDLETGHYFEGNWIQRRWYKSFNSILNLVRDKKNSQIQDTEISWLWQVPGLWTVTPYKCEHGIRLAPGYRATHQDIYNLLIRSTS